MFKFRHITFLLILSSLVACNKRDKLDTPDFNVTTERSEYKAGDSIIFKFTNSPDLITFYSGEPGYEYQFKDRTELEGGTTFMSFSSWVLFGSQTNNFHVMVSNDFSGLYDTNSVKAATWTEITNRYTLASAPAGGNSGEMPAGEANISDLIVKGKPVYIAFRYLGEKPPGTTPTQRTWRVKNFILKNTYPDGTMASLSSMFTAGWVNVDFKNPNNFWKQEVALGYLNYAPNSSLVESEDWAISKPFYVSRVLPDKGVAIKEYMARKTEHVYIFNQPGTYKVTFVGTNANSKETKMQVKELEIKITN